MSVRSVDRAITLLQLLGEEPCGLADIAGRASLPLSTTSRLLDTLSARQAIRRTDDGVYHLGSMMRRLAGSDVASVATIESCSAEALANLSSELGEAACLSLPAGTETLTLMQIDAPKPVQAQDWTGHRWPMTSGGSGAVMMATWPDERVGPIVELLPKNERAAARRAIRDAKSEGVSWSRDTYVDGLSSLAAPVLGSDGCAIAAVLAYGPSYRFPEPNREPVVVAAVLAAAAAVTERLEG